MIKEIVASGSLMFLLYSCGSDGTIRKTHDIDIIISPRISAQQEAPQKSPLIESSPPRERSNTQEVPPQPPVADSRISSRASIQLAIPPQQHTVESRTSLRGSIQQFALKEWNVQLFGKYLNSLADDASNAQGECTGSSDLENMVCTIPENFLVDEMHLYGLVNKKDLMFSLYQSYHGDQLLLLTTPIAIGGRTKDHSTEKLRDFSTPSGTFYIKRIVREPWWFPPKWAEEKRPVKPGKNNPYGLWMAELAVNDTPADYRFSVPGDSSTRLHSTNKPKSIGTRSSHGCIRIHPTVAEELFPALLHYTNHKEPITNSRGTIYPLTRAIRVEIR
jgi:hypothetical protein